MGWMRPVGDMERHFSLVAGFPGLRWGEDGGIVCTKGGFPMTKKLARQFPAYAVGA